MAIITTQVNKTYKDLDLNFTKHPVKKDVNKHTDATAVINSIKNLILTKHYERPFQPDIGSNVQNLLFENLDRITAATLEREITQVINTYEPRAKISRLTATPDIYNNAYTLNMEFFILSRTEPITINFTLNRVR
jgi:phage baseplate assembly protein W